MRRSSNLDWIFTSMILYLSQKCRHSSPTGPPEKTSFTPASASPLMSASTRSSSLRAYPSSSSPLCSSTVPLVSVIARSSPSLYTATLASSTCSVLPSGDRRITSPWITWLLDSPEPTTLAMRTSSTRKLCGFLGQTAMHASAVSLASVWWYPYCLVAMAVASAPETASMLKTSSDSDPGSTSSSRISSARAHAFSYPAAISTGCRPSCMSASELASSSDAKETTKFVPSPSSLSMVSAAYTIIFAAG
mmetsp:Transcript_6626/g.15013  ORF Transcript_6626/g.15013 Transcript_6626/m.15013 type:complete len:248 (+) Transcript_6626:841-1584(+)